MDNKILVEVSNDHKRIYGTIKKAISEGYFMVWTPERIRGAFSNGHGTLKDFNRYKDDNRIFCTIIELTEGELIRLYPEYGYYTR